MFTQRPLPRMPWKRTLVVVMAFSGFSALTAWLAVWFDFPWLAALPFLASLPVGYYFFWVKRCPECGQRLTSRREMLGASTEFRLLQRCDRCHIDWDTRLIGDTKYDEIPY